MTPSLTSLLVLLAMTLIGTRPCWQLVVQQRSLIKLLLLVLPLVVQQLSSN